MAFLAGATSSGRAVTVTYRVDVMVALLQDDDDGRVGSGTTGCCCFQKTMMMGLLMVVFLALTPLWAKNMMMGWIMATFSGCCCEPKML